MTDTEQKALALVNEVARERGYKYESVFLDRAFAESEALCRAIGQHEAFRQEVSDAVEHFKRCYPDYKHASLFDRFIIAKPVDPLVEALDEALWEVSNVKLTDRELRAVSLRLNAKRGGEIEGEKQ